MMKPILFNTQMVRAILDGRKTMTRRLIKDAPAHDDARPYLQPYTNRWAFIRNNARVYDVRNQYKKGDILYVRETWKTATIDPAGGGYALQDIYLYKADEPIDTTGMMVEERWHPSIHMPWVAARIFLRVKDIRVCRLHEITEEHAREEGVTDPYDYQSPEWYEAHKELTNSCDIAAFAGLWETTVKESERNSYGWDANPWVWVILFERTSKEEAEQGAK